MFYFCIEMHIGENIKMSILDFTEGLTPPHGAKINFGDWILKVLNTKD